MLLTNMYVIRFCLFLNNLILFPQRYKKNISYRNKDKKYLTLQPFSTFKQTTAHR